MATIAKDKGGGDFTPAPAGTHIARCVRVIDLGTQPGSGQFPQAQHKVQIDWELCEEKMEIEGMMTPFTVRREYTLSLHKKAVLRRELESWRGQPFTSEELDGFDIGKVLGQPAMVTVIHKPSADGTKTYANISAVTSVPKSMRQNTPPAVHDLLHYQIEDGAGGCFGKLSTYIQEKIRKAPEWPGTKDPHAGNNSDDDPGIGDDDIPF